MKNYKNTILELYEFGKKFLEKNNISTYNLDAKILICYISNIDTNQYFFHKNNIIEKNNIIKFINCLNRRAAGVSIAKIINKKCFWKYDFFVNKNVLDPRPDTENLIECVLKDYNTNDNLNILDLGTGSGCIVETLLKEFKNSKGIATDINKRSLDVAKFNAINLNIFNRIDFINTNWNDNIKKKFDIIVSNPPYIESNIINILENTVKKFEPFIALNGGDGGLECYKYIAKNIEKNCKQNTKIYLEIGYNQAQNVINIFKNENFNLLYLKKDLQDLDRILVFRK